MEGKNEFNSITEIKTIEKENKKNKIKENIIAKTILEELPDSEIVEVKNLDNS